MSARTVTAFCGAQQLAAGSLRNVARAVWHSMKSESRSYETVLLFDDDTGRVIDLEMRGDERDMLAHLEATEMVRLDAQRASRLDVDTADVAKGPRGRGRPRLGVVAREVTLLPRHWEWLASQPGGASVALRRLVDEARRTHAVHDRLQASRSAAYHFMQAIAGDRENFEEATRALYRGDAAQFATIIGSWPTDIRAYAMQLAFPTNHRRDGTP